LVSTYGSPAEARTEKYMLFNRWIAIEKLLLLAPDDLYFFYMKDIYQLADQIEVKRDF
jgi:hypothetical protein